jgi:hypothetical protein
MKRFSTGKAASGAAVVASLLVGAATPKAANAHYVERVEGGWAWVRYTVKGAQGPLMRVRQQDVGKYVSVPTAHRVSCGDRRQGPAVDICASQAQRRGRRRMGACSLAGREVSSEQPRAVAACFCERLRLLSLPSLGQQGACDYA